MKKATPTRIVKEKSVLERIPVSRATLWRWERDGKFPKRRRFGGGRSVGWDESVITEFIKSKMF